MIRLTLILLACLVSAMLIWGNEAPQTRAEAITSDVLDDPEVVEVVEVVATEAAPEVIAEVAPEVVVAEPEVEVTRLETVSFNNVAATSALLVVQANDAPADARVIAEPVIVPDDAKLLVVTGTRVNMRAGPSISREVVGRLQRGAQTQLIAEAGDGWLHIRDLSSGRTGYMSGDFLKAVN